MNGTVFRKHDALNRSPFRSGCAGACACASIGTDKVRLALTKILSCTKEKTFQIFSIRHILTELKIALETDMMILLWIFIGIAGRLVIHIPDVTPLSALCLFAPQFFSKRNAILITTVTLLSSDLLLHYFFHYTVFGSWTLFTYSGWLGVVIFGLFLLKNNSFSRTIIFTLFSSLFFWIWTNFGTWCATTIYAHTLFGLQECYIAALPFLRNGVLGALTWTALIQLLFRCNIIHRHVPAFRN